MLMLNRIHRVPSFARMHQEMNDLFQAMVSDAAIPAPCFAPAMNVWETDSNYFIEAELPGFRMEDIEVSVLGDEVTIKGERKTTAPEKAAYLRRERRLGEFTRTFTLPNGIESQHVEASLIDGVLLVTLPKSPAAQPRRIAVNSSK
jgi:HSP20 family protein